MSSKTFHTMGCLQEPAGESPKVGEIAMKVQERRRNWCGHMMSREGHYLGRWVMEMEVGTSDAEETNG